jgi:hypothetical protein
VTLASGSSGFVLLGDAVGMRLRFNADLQYNGVAFEFLAPSGEARRGGAARAFAH